MSSQVDATRSIYLAGGMLTALGLVELRNHDLIWGGLALAVGIALIVQRAIRNWRRDRA